MGSFYQRDDEQRMETQHDNLGIAPVAPLATGSSQVNVGSTERIISATAGALLTTLGLRQGSLLVTLLGGYVLYRGATGYCPISTVIGRDTSDADSQPEPLEITGMVTVNKPRPEVYQFWRQLENLPLFMRHLKRVTQLDNRRSHWEAQVASSNPVAQTLGQIAWDAEILDEDENNRLIWRSVPGASWDNAGEVRFLDTPGGNGTDVIATIRFTPPAGQLGEVVAGWFYTTLREMITKDIQGFKHYMETGEGLSDELPLQESEVGGLGIS